MKRTLLLLTLFIALLLLTCAFCAGAAAYTARVSQELLTLWARTPEGKTDAAAGREARLLAKEIEALIYKEEEKLAFFIRYDTVNRAHTAASLFCAAADAGSDEDYRRARITLFDALGTLDRSGALSFELFF
ncbi:MAG: hypothetical protein IJS45_00965 [Clostridia bacterium]|nr:hypothetical protein [Clostridia bacterium]